MRVGSIIHDGTPHLKTLRLCNRSPQEGSHPYNKDMRRWFCCLVFLVSLVFGLRANAQAFDLAGPKVDVHVKRGQATLPIGEVPNLLPGDRLWIHPDFPDSQSARYVLIVAFLRGVTN